MLVKTRNEAVRRHHGALTKDAGVQSRLSGREPETQGSGRLNPANMICIFCASRSEL